MARKSLRPQLNQIRAWVRQGRTDAWVAHQLEVSVRDIDDMLRQYVEPVEVEVFHYTRKWLQKMSSIEIDRSVSQIRTARQMDLPPKLVIPMRVIMSVAAILCQLDAHVPIKALSEELIPGFAEPDPVML